MNKLDYKLSPKFTKEFVEQNIKVDWGDLAWALSNHWLDVSSIAELAEVLALKNEYLFTSLAIARINNDAPALETLVFQQAQKFTVPDELIRERWMLLAVRWLYQHRNTFDNPWLVIEELWAAFGYPSSLNCLIRWMPIPSDRKAGEETMLEKWHTLATS